MIVAKNLFKTFYVKEGNLFKKKKRYIEAVQGINLEIREGQIVGLIGINGAGKTTTIKMLSTLLKPSSGDIHMDGLDIVSNFKEARAKINLISGGERNLYWRLTAKENLNYFGSLYFLSGKVLESRVEKLLDMVGLTENADLPIEKYSKGMKQRLQIARGLINDPKYIFLDEPTLGLDVIVAKEMRSYIKMLAKAEGKGVLLTSHYLSEVDELCDYVYVINSGEIIAQGTIDDIKKSVKQQYRHIFTVKELVSDYDTLCRKLSALGVKVEKVEDLEISTICDENKLVPILQTLNDFGLEVTSVKSIEPSLEDAIVDLLNKEN